MTRTPRTLAQLEEMAASIIEQAKEQLLETGNVMPTVVLSDAIDGSKDLVVAMESEVMSSRESKAAVKGRLEAEIAEHGFMQMTFMSDTYSIKASKEEQKVIGAIIKLTGLGLLEIHESTGMGELMEAIMVTVQVVGRNIMYTTPYARDADKKVVSFEEIQRSENYLPPNRINFIGLW